MISEPTRFRPSAIREILAAEGISAAEFGRRIRVSRQRVHAWLRGDVNPQLALVGAMAKAFNRPLEFFIETETRADASAEKPDE